MVVFLCFVGYLFYSHVHSFTNHRFIVFLFFSLSRTHLYFHIMLNGDGARVYLGGHPFSVELRSSVDLRKTSSLSR